MNRLVNHAPWLIVVAWWVYDLQVHWLALVEFQHGWLVVPLAAYLAWERKPTRPRVEPPTSLRGPLLLALASVPFVLFAELFKNAIASTPTSSFALSLGCVGFLFAILWQQYGTPVARHYLFPILFIFVAVPIPKIVWNPIVLGLQGLVTALNVETLNLIGIPAHRTGNLIHLPRGTVGVDEACSGIRSLQSCIMAALFIADLTFRHTTLKVFLLVAGVGLAVTGNFGRSLYLSLTAERQGIAAVGTVHDTAGWGVLLFTAVGLALVAWRAARAEQRFLLSATGADAPTAPPTEPPVGSS